MVHISRIIIRNFKSFGGDPIKLQFQPGFNIITGPNGSGKSNILDAVQFVLGELGSKRMRAPDLSGLIYDGAGEEHIGRAQMALVTLYFDNMDRGLAIDRSTVSVGRKMDREGKSDYLLNGKRTSRRQLVELLEMAGIAAGGYNIVLQGTATRLSDLTPSERMGALEDLVGIREYDLKKADARVKLNEAERKIEVASARIEEIKKQVNDLERQRNNAILFNLLDEEENKLSAHRHSVQINDLESKLGELDNQIEEKEQELKTLDEERTKFVEEKNQAQQRMDEFNREASERGNTRLPLLRSDLVGKNTLKESHESRKKEIDQRKLQLEKTIIEKEADIEKSKNEVTSRNTRLQQISKDELGLSSELDEKRETQIELNQKILGARETAEQNQLKLEALTESLIPMQEILTGVETDINKHVFAKDSIDERMVGFHERSQQFMERRESLETSVKEYEQLKIDEAKKLEDMIQTVESQVERQRNIRSTIENANQLAKDAETTITELAAKRDLWKNIVTEDKALERIREIGEAGAMDGYHGQLRSLLRIDLQIQRAAESSSNGWINAVVVDDYATAKEHIERLKKTRVGMTRFIPLEQLRAPEPLPELKIKGVVGAFPELIRYDELYSPAVYLLWGDTYLVEDPEAAEMVNTQGYRAVTKNGDVFESEGGIIGGYYRRPPDFTKLIPSEESISSLSTTIKDLRGKLKSRMKELKTSGFDLRKFTQYMEDSQERVSRIDEDIKATVESIQRLDRSLQTLMESIEKAKGDKDNEERLRIILEERKAKTLEQIESTKREINRLKEYKLSDVASLELERNSLNHEIGLLERRINELSNDRTIQSSFVDRILNLQITEAAQDIETARREIDVLSREYLEIDNQIVEISRDIAELDAILGEVTTEVEATSRVFEQHQRTLRQYDRQLEQLARRFTDVERRNGQLSLEKERIKLQIEQRLDELARLGFSDKIQLEEMLPEQVERRLAWIRQEKRGMGAINQLAVDHYHITMREYKQRSTRINGMEEEKQSILNFIEEIEHEKQEHFMTAYDQICENFSSIFSKLTGGGDGRLELQRPEDPFSGGVDLYIQFPGKPMRLASGASGGERSVAAIAYLLAIQRFLKAPFYLFDEIDAHLDDLNTSRLADVLKENAADGQFLMISLKDVMVHNADRIYGVFAQNGRSRVLALPMKEAKVAA
ncbi:chromosome segregation protein SMC [Candidatus Bathyarchaeota archaeon]|nr:MAG: chromosome segregation protein SMC [Candidatus Bathyarchaeota archaeon]